MSYFRIKEITSPATILRQGNLLSIDLGDFMYPEEVDTIVCSTTIVYFDDRTGEHFTWTPDMVATPAIKVGLAPVETPTETPVETPTEVVPAPLETGSEDTKA